MWKAKLPMRIQEAVCEYDPRTVLTIPNSVKNYTAYSGHLDKRPGTYAVGGITESRGSSF
eukprot:5489115-Pyramimonas_sp.AAC.1